MPVSFPQFSFLSRRRGVSAALTLTGGDLHLRAGKPKDWSTWKALREASQQFLAEFEPSWPANALSQTFFEGMLRRQRREWREGRAFAFLIFRRQEEKFVLTGGISLNDIRRGIAQKGTLGYWMGVPYVRQGIMTEAATIVTRFAFADLKLHRIEASCLPHNEPSKLLLSKLEFSEEGYAKQYLKIQSQWRDHLLFSKINPS